MTDWHRHWGSSTVDMGNSSYTMMSHSPEWWMIFCHRPLEPSNQRLYYISSEMEVPDVTILPNWSGGCCMQAGDAYSSWAPDLTPIPGVRFFSYGRGFCLFSLVPVLSWFCMPSVCDFLNYRFWAFNRDMVIIHSCQLNLVCMINFTKYHCKWFES